MPDKTINENLLRITGEASLPKPLELDKDYSVKLEVSVVSTAQRSKQDGSFDNIVKAKILTGEVLNEIGESMKIRDRNSNSKKLRNLIYKDWLEAGTDVDEELFYDIYMCKLLANHYLVKEFLRNK